MRAQNYFSQPGGGQRGGAQAEIWEALQWGDRNSPEGCSQLYDCPWQGRGYNPPPTRAFQLQVHPSQVQIPHCLCKHLRDVLFKVVFHLLCSIHKGRPFFSHLSLFCPLREVHQKTPGAIVFSSFYSHSYIFFAPLLFLSNVDIFKRATLSEMVNRRGTSSTHARLSKAKVIPSYVSSPDVLLTAIDFHLFIFTLRIRSPLLLFLTSKQQPCHSERRCFAEILNLIWLSFFLGISPATGLVTPAPTAVVNSHNLKATDSTYCLMLPHILSVWIGISFEQFYSDKSL